MVTSPAYDASVHDRRPPLRLLRLANPVVRLVLRSPAHRLLDRSLMLLTYTGRRSGRTFTIPVLYARVEGGVLALAATPQAKQWWRTFRSGAAPVTLRIAGTVVQAQGRLLAAEEARHGLRIYLDRFPRAARTLGAEATGTDEELDNAAGRAALVAFVTRGEGP